MYSPLNPFVYIHWILDFKYIIILLYIIYAWHVQFYIEGETRLKYILLLNKVVCYLTYVKLFSGLVLLDFLIFLSFVSAPNKML